MILSLEYGLDVEYYRTFYGRPGLVNYADNNYTSDNKNRQLTISYIY